MKNWFKSWGFPGLAIFISLCSVFITAMIYQANVEYNKANVEHAQHIEIRNKLLLLDSRIQRAIYMTPSGDTEAQSAIVEAIDLRDEAEKAWSEGRLSEADKFIHKSFEIVENIPVPEQVPPAMPPAAPPPPPPVVPPPVAPPAPAVNWWIIGGVIGGIVAGATVVWLTVIRRRAE